MFNQNHYKFSVKLSEEDIQKLHEIYNSGERDGYDDGFTDGKVEAEEELEGLRSEFVEIGYDSAISDFENMIGYSNLIRLQEKTGHQICFGSDINVTEMVSAIKTLIEK